MSRSPYYCPRCKTGFLSEIDMSEHLMVPVEQMCEARPASSNRSEEDGITEEMDRILADTTRRYKAQTWEEIWRLLFPGDVTVLDPGKLMSSSLNVPMDIEPALNANAVPRIPTCRRDGRDGTGTR